MIETVRPFTMVSADALTDLARRVESIVSTDVGGDLAECGTWRGGSAFLMASVLRHLGVVDRRVWLFDSFAGLPGAQPIDGESAMQYSANAAEGRNDNCLATVEDARRTATALGVSEVCRFVPGWFEDTLPTYRAQIGELALLRIDCDWHDPVVCCLENLYDNVTDGGFILCDDYYTWDGATIAVHEFLAARKLAHPVETIFGRSGPAGACLRKVTSDRRRLQIWQARLESATGQILRSSAPGDVIAVAGSERIRKDACSDRLILPFPERAGEYWGPPANTDAAIREVERARISGCRYLAFLWEEFWWLEYYTQLDHYCRSKYALTTEDSNVMLFSLID